MSSRSRLQRLGDWITAGEVDGGGGVEAEPALAWRQQSAATALPAPAVADGAPLAVRVMATLGIALVAGPMAVVVALYGNTTVPGLVLLFVAVLVAPIVEEVAKSAAPLWLATRRPHLVLGAGGLVLACAISGLAFAAIENIYYTTFVFPGDAQVAALRWRLTPWLHGGCSTVVGIGLAREWVRARSAGLPIQPYRLRVWIAAAAVLHGLWNGGSLLLGVLSAP